MIVIALLFLPAHAWAGAEAHVDRTSLGPGETLTLYISIDGDGDVDIAPIKDFTVLSRGSSSSLNIINGKMSRKQELQFILAPKKKNGELLIPALTVNTDDGAVKTKPIKIMVSSKPSSRVDGSASDVFLRAVISDNEPFVGQQIIYQLKIFRAVRIANAQLQDLEFSGFTSRQIEDQKDYTTTLQGRQYAVTELSFVLSPLKEGRHEIGPGVMSCDVVLKSRGRSNSMFDQFFGSDPFFSGGRLEPRVYQSEKAILNVRPLPAYKGTGKFSGLVGRFDFKSDLDPASVAVGDSVAYSVVIEGQGNIMDAGKPAFPEVDGLKIYSDKPEEQISLGPGGYTGKKVFRFALAPYKPGRYTTPALEMNYFDPEQQAYVSKHIKPRELAVRPGKVQQPQVVSSRGAPPNTGETVAKKKVEFIDKDILPLKDDPAALTTGPPLSPAVFFILLFSPMLAFGAAGLVRQRAGKRKNTSRVMAERAWNALKAASDADDTDRLGLCSKAIIAAVCSKADREGEALTYDEVDELLSSCASRDVGCKVKEFMERIDNARYGGKPLDRAEIENIVSQTRELVKSLCR